MAGRRARHRATHTATAAATVDDAVAARRAMDDAAFKRDRLIAAVKRLRVRVD